MRKPKLQLKVTMLTVGRAEFESLDSTTRS